MTENPKFTVPIAVLLMLYPSLMFAVKGGMNGTFLLLLLMSAAALCSSSMPQVKWDRDLMHYLLAMVALPVAIFLSQSYHHSYSGHPYDAASRFMLAVPIFMLLQRLRCSIIATLQYGFPLAAITGLLLSREIADGRLGITTLDLIHFGNFELVLGFLSVFSINWTGRDEFLLKALKIAGFLAGIYASIASGSRGGWIALPVFLLIFIHFRYGKISLRAMAALVLMLIITAIIGYTASREVHHRVDEMARDLTAFEQGNPDTSIGIRLQLFRAAAVIALKNPVFGAGPDGFAREMDPMLRAGELTPLAADLGKGEVHNELLSKTAALGIFGLTAMLAIYLVPLGMFYRAMGSATGQVRQAGMMGMAFVSGFMVFGLTVEVLNLTMAAAFYSLTVAVLLAACYNIHHGYQSEMH